MQVINVSFFQIFVWQIYPAFPWRITQSYLLSKPKDGLWIYEVRVVLLWLRKAECPTGLEGNVNISSELKNVCLTPSGVKSLLRKSRYKKTKSERSMVLSILLKVRRLLHIRGGGLVIHDCPVRQTEYSYPVSIISKLESLHSKDLKLA